MISVLKNLLRLNLLSQTQFVANTYPAEGETPTLESTWEVVYS